MEIFRLKLTIEENPLCVTAGLAAIHYIEEHGLVDHAAAMGDYLMAELFAMKERFPVIGHVAGKGLHIGIDLVKDPVSKERAVTYAEQVMYEALKRGVAFKVIEGNIITLRPSLIISKEQCTEVLQVLTEIFTRIVTR